MYRPIEMLLEYMTANTGNVLGSWLEWTHLCLAVWHRRYGWCQRSEAVSATTIYQQQIHYWLVHKNLRNSLLNHS